MGKRFEIQCQTRMYNLAESTRRKISISTYYRYKPKAAKLQGHIPFRQSCCERCQNFENTLNEASKFLSGVPRDVGDAIDKSLCEYSGYFPNLSCILCTCKKCGTDVLKNFILQNNALKIEDQRKRFLVKLWVTRTEKKEGVSQSFLDWKFERCNYVELIGLLMDKMTMMSEHTFMASWNYCQYKQARKDILVGDVIYVHDFAQNYLCKHQNEVQGLHWRHKQVTLMPIVAHYKCSKCQQLVTHEIVHVSDDMKHDEHLVKMFTEKSIQVLKDTNVNIRKIIKFTDQAPSQYKNKTAFTYLANSDIPTQRITLVLDMVRAHVMLVLGG